MALAATTALGVGLMAAPAIAADSTSGSTAPGTKPVLTAPTAPTAQQQEILDARVEAKATGRTVAVETMTTETSRTLVNPDGTLTTTDNAKPVRAKRGAAWADLDATLRRNADGTISPLVTSSALAVSGGGSGPLATITTADGKKLAVGAPFALPAPTLDGDTATYADVLPDVDLELTALPDGGWRDVFVVRTAAAAADPRLKSIHFPITAAGLNVATDAAGNVSFKDGTGKVRLQAPTPFQWDSTSTAARTPPRAAARDDDIPKVQRSSSRGPGENAKVGRIGIKAGNSGLDLTPDPATFGKGSGPWYLDPTISADSASTMSVQVQEYHPDTKYADSISNLGLGYCGYSDCTGSGRERAYYRIGVNSAIYNQPVDAPAPPTVYSSTFYANVTGASSPSTSTPLGLYWTGGISSNTTWNNQPCSGSGTMGGCSKIGNSTWIIGTGPIAFDVTWHMQQAAANHSADLTVGVAPDDENNKYYRKHLANNPHVTTNYDITPSMWWPRTSPTPGFAKTRSYNDCQTPGGSAWDNPGWVGANQNIVLNAKDWSPAGLPVYGNFRLWDDNDPNFGWVGNSPKTGSYNDEAVAVGSLTDGHQYGWTATATDDTLTSPETSWCYFRVDKTAPTVAVGSTDFPPSGTPNATPAKYATDTGTFSITGTDPAPGAGLNASGLACFRVSTSSTPVTGWHCGDAGTLSADANGKAAYSYVPGTWGTNILYVQAQDDAGNYSQPSAYSFYAPWKPGTMPVFGDLTGDQKPDLLLPDANGNLRLINTSNDPANANPIAGAGAASPTGTWNGVQVTHRASLLAGKPVDDLIAHPAGDPRLYLYANDGHGNFVTRTAFYKSGTTVNSAVTCQDINGGTIACPADFGTDWTNATQILAVGTPEGENATKDANGNYVLTRTSILAVINHQLWLFPPGTSSARLLKPVDTQVSSANWDTYDLIGPGQANGNNQPTLWTRDRSNGTIHAYPITTKAGGGVDFSALVDPTTGYISGTGGVDPTTYPLVGSNGDLNGDGVADLWARTNDGRLLVWPGAANAGGTVVGFTAPSTLGDLRAPAARWRLNETAGATTAADSAGLHPGTVKTGVTFGSATVNNRTTNVATFDGVKGEIDTTGTSIDTTKSFTVSVWANPASAGGPVVSQDGTSTSGFILWPEASDGTWRFGMSTADDNNWSYDQTIVGMTSAARYQNGRWDRLTASYNATGGQIQLYVNGVLAGTGIHTSTSGITGPVILGRYKYQGASTSWFKGSASDLVAYNYPTDPWSSTAGQIALTGFAGKCMDVNGGATAAGTAVQVWDCNGSTAQRWTVNANGTLSSNGMCLDAPGGGTANGTVMEIWTCGSNPAWPNQVFVPLANGAIYNPVSGRCVDVPNANTANGTRLALYDCNRTPAQTWSVGRS
ncbi:hypothetical protein KNE206_19260 [Kitasatospora sp. NE20-6]|uniref:ricin-type beta-trefoil lectin domain protein n=1 Tax=Kitasatospora sp. NE20-6 TaxID=2859066 RepID=UPI0034DC6A02